ncbi:MAG: CHAD domain-containing protein, partial [Solirubrobacterales bacterium]
MLPGQGLWPGTHRDQAPRRRARRAPRPRRRHRRAARLQRPDGGARSPRSRLADRAVPRRAGGGERGLGAAGFGREREGAAREHRRADQRSPGGGGVKARPVKKLDPSRSLGENAARIVKLRLDEMLELAPRALDGKTKAQHDMRIAAKRLRYVLEVTGFCFGRPADTARRRARDLQDILGEIHDCDVMLPRVREHLEELQRSDAGAVRERAGKAPDLDPRIAAHAPHRTAYRGLDVLAVYLEARRELLTDRFIDFWKRHEETGTWKRLERSVDG